MELKKKSEMSEIWDPLAGDSFRYYMVFKTGNVRIARKIVLADLKNILDKF